MYNFLANVSITSCLAYPQESSYSTGIASYTNPWYVDWLWLLIVAAVILGVLFVCCWFAVFFYQCYRRRKRRQVASSTIAGSSLVIQLASNKEAEVIKTNIKEDNKSFELTDHKIHSDRQIFM